MRQIAPLLAGLVLLSPAPAGAAQSSLVTVEGLVGTGISIGASGGHSVIRMAPLTLTLAADIAINNDPRLEIYAGIRGETLNREAVGVLAGLRLRPLKGKLRLGAGAVALLFPYTLVGVSGSLGTCFRLPRSLKSVSLCGDVEGTAYVFGSDLPEKRVAGQLQVALGVSFDAL